MREQERSQMSSKSVYILTCEADYFVTDPGTARVPAMRRRVTCHQRFETHEASGKCPHCQTPFEIDWNGEPAAGEKEEKSRPRTRE